MIGTSILEIKEKRYFAMKKILFGLNLILIFSVFCPAQDGTGSLKGSASAKGGNSSLQAGTGIEAQLQQTLDVKNARVGDQVVMKVTRSIKQNGRTVVEKGSKLVGRVTEVQQKAKNNAMSKLGVVFDRIQGESLNSPISASIVSFSQVAANTGIDDTFDTGIMGSSSSSGSVSRSSSSNSGGLLGGTTRAVGGVLNSTTNTAANTVGTVTNTTRQTAGTVAGTAGTVANTAGRTINGINISRSAGASAQGGTTLSTQNKNLRLEKGATFQLQVNGSVSKN